jgi:uncharacterized protein (DUF1778 family)
MPYITAASGRLPDIPTRPRDFAMTTIVNRRGPGRGETKDERLEARVPAELKTMFQRAADLEGLTLTDYVISALVEKSRSTIREHEVITLTGRNREVFLEALQNPPKISPKLAAALAKLEGPEANDTRRTGGVARDTQQSRLRKRKRAAR